MNALKLLLLAASMAVSVADIYMHNLAGSNNRNRERNDNRNNNNRIFDSQNNAKGGYPWRGDRTLIGRPDPLNLYEGSMLQMEWTLQHSCGSNPNAHCSVVFQYACEDTLPKVRDGYPSGPDLVPINNNGGNDFQQASFVRNKDGTGQIDTTDVSEADIEYGMHENLNYYRQCLTRQRNKGLYTADQKLSGDAAIYTRQNPNGGRSGYECPEERDYYPYWHPSPWRDVAILTSNETFCPYYTSRSQNVASSFYCAMSEDNRQKAPGKLRPISATACTQYGGVWTEVPAFGTDAPTCALHEFSRDNHLGNVGSKAADGSPLAASYKWQIPYVSQMYSRSNYPFDAAVQSPQAVKATKMTQAGSLDDGGLLCVARLRYNISTNDYPSMKGMDGSSDRFFDSSFNCARVSLSNSATGDVDEGGTSAASSDVTCSNLLADSRRPRYNRPYVQMFSDRNTPLLSIAMNTNQLGRTFQDRSYVFKIVPRPNSVPANAVIWNLNNRGKRGNIVQAYPAVEYDFVPQVLNAHKDDYLHVQFHGSDFNTARNPNNAEGWQFSDRFNMVQTEEANTQIPLSARDSRLFQDEKEAKLYALLGQEKLTNSSGLPVCRYFEAGKDNEQNSPYNCGKLNAAPAHMDFGLKPLTSIARGTYHYLSTRNNNFSNRSQKGVLIVSGLSVAETVGVALGVTAFVGVSAAGALFAVRRVPKRLASDGQRV